MSRYETITERYETLEEVSKFNPYHDARGRFASANSATSFTYAPGKSKAHDLAIARAKVNHVAAGAAQLAATRDEKRKAIADKFGQAEKDALGENHVYAISDALLHSSAEVQKAWMTYGDQVHFASVDYKGGAHCKGGSGDINLNIEDVAKGNRIKTPYQTALHEMGHSVEEAISRKLNGLYEAYPGRYKGFAETYNDGEFSKTLVKETNRYFKTQQTQMSQRVGQKLTIDTVRKTVSLNLSADALGNSMVSDILGGATKGKFSGPSGHSKKYWTGWKDYWGDTRGAHDVSTEAFAHFFSAGINSKGRAALLEIFPESYKVFSRMLTEACEL